MADRGNQGQRPQYEVHYDFSLNLDLLSPSPVESYKLLLGSQTIIEDAQNVLLRAELSQSLDSPGTCFSSGFIPECGGLGFHPLLVASQRGHVGGG